MREIKFRAWDKEEKLMIFSKAGYEDFDLFVILRKPKLFNVMQYTGLKDKNGKEIYEGDILQNLSYNKPSTIVISWCKTDACFVNYGWDLPFNLTEIYEVTGNIYENPELLKNE